MSRKPAKIRGYKSQWLHHLREQNHFDSALFVLQRVRQYILVRKRSKKKTLPTSEKILFSFSQMFKNHCGLPFLLHQIFPSGFSAQN